MSRELSDLEMIIDAMRERKDAEIRDLRRQLFEQQRDALMLLGAILLQNGCEIRVSDQAMNAVDHNMRIDRWYEESTMSTVFRLYTGR